jgi:PAS domain S-box-containing protein
VNELHKVLVPPRGLFASGKFDQYQRDIPYATLAQAFQSLLRPLLGQSEEQLDRWREALSDALGDNGQLVVNLVPELELVIGTQPPVPELPPQEAKNRFQMAFRRFLGVFARKEHPLALFLDDLQWLDTATLDLIEHLVTHPEVRHLLVVGAYRDNEVGTAHPLRRTLEAIRDADARVHEIALAPLGLDDVGRLVAAALHCEPEHVLPLAQLVQEKTGGNPFFAIQFLTTLAEESLLTYDPAASAWAWDIDRIRAKSYTDNVVDLMAGKLKRLSAGTQEALKQLACLGNVAEIATLTLVHADTGKAMHAALWEAVLAGLVLREDDAYKFLHDRIQQAAYSLIPEERRADIHLRIGRALLASMTAHELAEYVFDVANQFNRGAALLTERDEKAQVAAINLRAGRRAKASAAYASACVYLAAGMNLLDDGDWGSQYEVMFSLWLERAACAFLTGHLDQAEQVIEALLQRAASKIDQAAACHLKLQFHVVRSENSQAANSALECLRLFGIDLPAHPTQEQVQAEYETVWRNLAERQIDSLIHLPLMTDPELHAAMRLLSALFQPAYFIDSHLLCLLLCRMVNIGLQHGASGAFAHACGSLGVLLGPVFHRYYDGYRFAKLACDLVDKHGFLADRAKVHAAMGRTAVWTQPIATANDFHRAASRTALETGDLTCACYSMGHVIADLLLRNDPLDAVWRESERTLDYVRKARFRDVADLITCLQRLIATLQGRTASLSTFSDAQFDEAAFEAQLTGDRMSALICGYWVLKLQAHFLAGDYVAALAAARRAQPLLWALVGQIMWFDHTYYTALTVAALYENATTDEQAGWREILTVHREQLREWAHNSPQTFADKHALVSAELARVEGRDPDAMRLYEQAIHAAREHGFVGYEGIAHEVAAQFYAARGFETIAHAYLRNARYCYLRWGALGKVTQLDELYPRLREESASFAPTATIGASFEHLDVGTVVKASQAVSGEIELGKLIETLLTIAVEHAGAQRGLLILCQGDEPRIEAEATTSRGSVEVTLRQTAVTASELPESVLHYAIRTRENVLLDDGTAPTLFSADAYMQQRLPRSVLCLPLVKQAKLVGALYLENNLTPRAFTSGCIAVLEVLATQAAISLENARLYSDLQHSEAFLAEGQSISSTGSFGWSLRSGEIYWSDETYRIFGYDRAAKPTVERVLQRVHPDDLALVQEVIARVSREMTNFDVENRLLMEDGTVKTVHVIGRAIQTPSGEIEFVGAVMDVTEQKWALAERARLEQRLRQAEKMEAVGRLAGGIAHDFNNILAGVFAYGEMVFDEAPEGSPLRRYAHNVLTAASRGRELVEQILAYSRSQRGKRAPVEVAQVVAETLELIRGSLPANVRLEANAPELPLVVVGNATQLHQIVMNLCSNAIQGMRTGGILRVALEIAEFSGEQALSHGTLEPGRYVRLIVEDSGSGMDEATLTRIFEPFFTTKEIGQGTGLGLSLVYAIVTDSGGAIDVKSAPQQGSAFTIYLRRSDVADFGEGERSFR